MQLMGHTYRAQRVRSFSQSMQSMRQVLANTVYSTGAQSGLDLASSGSKLTSWMC